MSESIDLPAERFHFASECPSGSDGGHEWEDGWEMYGVDADGNRGTRVEFTRCKFCGEEA